MDIEWTIIPSPHAIGPHNIADVQGNKHTIVFHRTPGPLDTASRPIVVTGDNSTIRNETEYRIILESGANNNTITSAGEVIDNGSNNDVTQIGVVNTLMDVKAIKPSPIFKKIDKILIVNNAPDIRNLEVYDLKGRLKTRSWGPSIQKGVLLPKGVYIVKSGNKK